ncbi:MAG: EamA family transporter [Verrucomicrobiota bacterium]|nr:EamA family transporter [Verrucomicrobiota bacterium]
MKTWIIYALISAVFAGFTSVIAKLGLSGISGELGLAIRTCFVFVFVLAFAAVTIPSSQLSTLGRTNYIWLGISGVTTVASWVFYYKAIKDGQVSTVALIDKGSIVVSVLLAAIILKEQITARILIGAALMVAGLLIIARK